MRGTLVAGLIVVIGAVIAATQYDSIQDWLRDDVVASAPAEQTAQKPAASMLSDSQQRKPEATRAKPEPTSADQKTVQITRATRETKSPSFDVVRVNPRGDAVIAGRAEPGAEVTVKDAANVVGKVTADKRGEWVLVPEMPLPSGARQLNLEETTTSGEKKSSKDVVVLFVPERKPQGKGAPREAVAVLTPREGGGSKVLQGPSTPKLAKIERAKKTPEKLEVGDSQGMAAAASETPKPAEQVKGPAEETDSAKKNIGNIDKDLSLKIIDYDEEGRVVLSGKATPGSEVRVKVDDNPVGASKADAAGDWKISPTKPVVSGQHAIKIEQVDAGGTVLAKLVVPFSRAVVRPGTLAPGMVVVDPGNSLWRIARATYGSGNKYTLIFAANAEQISNPNMIYPGQMFIVPPDPASN